MNSEISYHYFVVINLLTRYVAKIKIADSYTSSIQLPSQTFTV